MLLIESAIDDYQNYGVTVLRNIISIEWIKKLQIGVIKNFQNPSKYKCVYEKNDKKELFYDDYCNWQRISEYKDFMFNSNIAYIASQLMKSSTPSSQLPSPQPALQSIVQFWLDSPWVQ